MKKNSENQEPEEYGGVKAVLMAAGAAVGGLLGYEIARNALNINLILLLAFIGAFLGRGIWWCLISARGRAHRNLNLRIICGVILFFLIVMVYMAATGQAETLTFLNVLLYLLIFVVIGVFCCGFFSLFIRK
jgi:predicted neutral ceramidase superfamily lipid hydrolase